MCYCTTDQLAIENLNCEKSFEVKNVLARYLFNKLILNIFRNFIPNKIINEKDPYNDKDSSSFNNEIWQILNKKMSYLNNSWTMENHKATLIDSNASVVTW